MNRIASALRVAGAVCLLSTVGFVRDAHAQSEASATVMASVEAPAPPPPIAIGEPVYHRQNGLGSVLGAGFSAAQFLNLNGGFISVGVALPTLEYQHFFRDSFSLSVSMPITNMVVTSLLIRGFVMQTDLYLSGHPGSRTVRAVLGGGVGGSFLTTPGIPGSVAGGSGGSLRFVSQFGVEFLNPAQTFGFSILIRPSMEFAFANTSGGTGSMGIGGGALAVLGFTGYFRRVE